MTSRFNYDSSLATLRSRLAGFRPGNQVYDEIVTHRAEVLARFGPLFSSGHIESLTKEEFTPFLYFEHNHHWTNLHRTGIGLTADMPALRSTLFLLVDEAKPIQKRFTSALASAKGLGPAIGTAILTVAYPDRYGVWNTTSEEGLSRIGAWPAARHGGRIGDQYASVNSTLLRLARDLSFNLWTLDALWWYILGGSQLPQSVRDDEFD
jgi:hypothetical protein